MKKPLYTYKPRFVCPQCLSLSIKKSYKKYKCDQCKNEFDKPNKVFLMHKENRCIDNNLDTRTKRFDKRTNTIFYK